MSNLKENLIKKCDEMIDNYTKMIDSANEQLGKIPSGRSKVWENSLLRSKTLHSFWSSLKQSLELDVYEK